jgi:uncharacterized membrane protein
MIRKIFSPDRLKSRGSSRKRDFEIQRIETFSDGVFAFAVTLLIVSLEVPKSFEDLLISMRGFFAFGISFAILFSIWSEQHRFFRSYGMEDGFTIFLNGALLFIVLFYTYPLKFLFTLLFSNQIYGTHDSPLKINTQQMPELMMIYALGFIMIYILFFLMYFNVYRKSNERGFTSFEKFDCRSEMYKEAIMIFTGVLSLVFVFFIKGEQSINSGMIYLLIPLGNIIFFTYRKKLRRKLFPQSDVEDTHPDTAD